jgi:hypothetical protein
MEKRILISCCLLLWGISEIVHFLCNFQKEEVWAIFFLRVKSHWHILYWYVAVIVVAIWRWHDFITNNMGLHHITITSSAGTSISISPNARSEARLQQTRRWFAIHYDRLNSRPGHIFLLGYIKDSVSLLHLPQDVSELWRRIIAAIPEIDCDVLQQIWAEMDYRLDVCPDTKGEHIQHLWDMQKNNNLERFSVHL